MARQVRSEVTRRKLLDAAVEVFSEVGYAATARVAIVERAGVTKGALYHHFDSMESLASAIIAEGCATVLDAFQASCPPSSPAVEGLIHGSFAAADVLVADKQARVASHLAVALAGFSDSAAAVHAGWLRAVAAVLRRAGAEGDLREDLDPDAVGESIVGAVFGAQLLSRGDLVGRLTRTWQLLLPAVVADASLRYFRVFLDRETLRHQRARAPDAT